MKLPSFWTRQSQALHPAVSSQTQIHSHGDNLSRPVPSENWDAPTCQIHQPMNIPEPSLPSSNSSSRAADGQSSDLADCIGGCDSSYFSRVSSKGRISAASQRPVSPHGQSRCPDCNGDMDNRPLQPSTTRTSCDYSIESNSETFGSALDTASTTNRSAIGTRIVCSCTVHDTRDDSLPKTRSSFEYTHDTHLNTATAIDTACTNTSTNTRSNTSTNTTTNTTVNTRSSGWKTLARVKAKAGAWVSHIPTSKSGKDTPSSTLYKDSGMPSCTLTIPSGVDGKDCDKSIKGLGCSQRKHTLPRKLPSSHKLEAALISGQAEVDPSNLGAATVLVREDQQSMSTEYQARIPKIRRHFFWPGRTTASSSSRLNDSTAESTRESPVGSPPSTACPTALQKKPSTTWAKNPLAWLQAHTNWWQSDSARQYTHTPPVSRESHISKCSPAQYVNTPYKHHMGGPISCSRLGKDRDLEEGLQFSLSNATLLDDLHQEKSLPFVGFNSNASVLDMMDNLADTSCFDKSNSKHHSIQNRGAAIMVKSGLARTAAAAMAAAAAATTTTTTTVR
ncbi:hypothetical protein BASA50_003610 [Batrachochytrium salamandrivorans]|uniref:Uncharacterized protein n=1 Tax=Batrachochytrium salamandrivorans TaxID=1357716 RepID=A0ABQ8FKU9_9FUNG|nr:hypothetical protein BASA60_008064 [Batrachochytrium salamandrivorans]KAH6598572.1 hypothetical protein BASA50_003610 [Batrachochytrium salamandrivorans]KAH6600748.1 hypothetical protein BASA61_002165 [Batrachochytrium salamandrivorans]KAH9266781.1 hypothetical protein BASA84_000969 [Batrachochytrium salamandrivorans]